LIWGESINNFAILGPGLIWGKGLSRGLSDKDHPRAEMPGAGNKAIALKNCHNVILRDFSILTGGHFGILATGVDNLTIDNLKIDTNRDGMVGLEFGAAYTWSRSMDYTDSYNGTIAVYKNPRTWNYGPAGWDHRNNLVGNYLWSFPKASSLWNSFVTRSIFDNWQISGIASYLEQFHRYCNVWIESLNHAFAFSGVMSAMASVIA
jgi:hypothetical protein